MSIDFAAIIPPQWAAIARPFLLRASEFQAKQPLIAYFLKTHVAYLCLKNRQSGNSSKEGTEFLMKLLGELEKDKNTLRAELESADGRTVLTKMALMLFTKADDMERGGIANETVVKLFYSANILFEATGQYLDGQLDPIAAEKCKYSKYIATKMKRCIDKAIPYTSHNELESQGVSEGGDVVPSESRFTMPPSSSASVTPPVAPPSSGYGGPPSVPPPPPTFVAPATFIPSTPQPPMNQPQPPATASPANVSQPFMHPPVIAQVAMPATAPSAAGHVPSMDAMIDAQKMCKQAVSALQFYDHANARKQLLAALALLGGGN